LKIQIRITESLRNAVVADLRRKHQFAAERVGFIWCRPVTAKSALLLIACSYSPVDDHHYLDDPNVGAMMGPDAIRTALQTCYRDQVSALHVHLHEHGGQPRFSPTDLRETAKFVPDFFNVAPLLPHGAMVFSDDSAVARCWLPPARVMCWAETVDVIGTQYRRSCFDC
jgi:hypothetical protein